MSWRDTGVLAVPSLSFYICSLIWNQCHHIRFCLDRANLPSLPVWPVEVDFLRSYKDSTTSSSNPEDTDACSKTHKQTTSSTELCDPCNQKRSMRNTTALVSSVAFYMCNEHLLKQWNNIAIAWLTTTTYNVVFRALPGGLTPIHTWDPVTSLSKPGVGTPTLRWVILWPVWHKRFPWWLSNDTQANPQSVCPHPGLNTWISHTSP